MNICNLLINDDEQVLACSIDKVPCTSAAFAMLNPSDHFAPISEYPEYSNIECTHGCTSVTPVYTVSENSAIAHDGWVGQEMCLEQIRRFP